MYLADDGSPIPEASTVGPLAAGVPGSPSGLFELHRRYGRTPWPQVVRPAIILARDGFVVSPRLHSAIVHRRAELGRFEESARVWLPGGGPPAIGTVMRLPELASTLERYAAEGPDGVMRGGVATAIVAASGRP